MKNLENIKIITASILLLIFVWLPYFDNTGSLSESIFMTTFVISLAVIGLKCDNKEIIYTIIGFFMFIVLWLPYFSNKLTLSETLQRVIVITVSAFLGGYISRKTIKTED